MCARNTVWMSGVLLRVLTAQLFSFALVLLLWRKYRNK